MCLASNSRRTLFEGCTDVAIRISSDNGFRAGRMNAAKQIWALDFDGVICDSCGESAISGWKAAEALWPETFTTQAAQSKKEEVLLQMRVVRPVVETGVVALSL